MTTAASRKTYLDAIMIIRCQGDDTFVTFQPMGIFRFWRNGQFTFFQRCLQPLYFSQSPPPTQLNLPFCAGVYGAFFLSKFNLLVVFTFDLRFSISVFFLFNLDIRFSTSTFVLFNLDSRFLSSTFALSSRS